jgi:hypothetical protein
VQHINPGFAVLIGTAYICLRIALHNLAYNLPAGKYWYHTGTTSFSDRLEKRMAIAGVVVIRLGCFLFGLFLIWQYFK